MLLHELLDKYKAQLDLIQSSTNPYIRALEASYKEFIRDLEMIQETIDALYPTE